MINFDDVKFYKPQHIDFDDNTKNGGMVSDEVIPSGELNNMFPEVTATEREDGVRKRLKVYIKNNNTERDMKNCWVSISKDCDLPDYLKLYAATKLQHFSFKFDGAVDSGTAAGTHVKYKDPNVDDADVFKNIAGRTILVNEQYLIVDDIDTDNNEIWFKEDTDGDIVDGDIGDTSDDDNKYESDEDWDNMDYYINAPIIKTLSNGEDNIVVNKTDANDMRVGDKLLIVNHYRRPLFRCEITEINDDDDDDSIKKLKINRPYSNETIPAMYGYVCSSVATEILSGKQVPVWVELNITASNALEAELTNSFQLELTFDDVAKQ